MNIAKIFKFVCSILCGAASYLWGELDGLLAALIVFMAVDYVTGMIAAYSQKELSSRVGFIGIAKKGMMMLIVAIGHVIDTQMFDGGSAVCRSIIIGFYIGNEGLSIMENTSVLGVPWPPALTEVLRQLNGKDKEDKDDE